MEADPSAARGLPAPPRAATTLHQTVTPAILSRRGKWSPGRNRRGYSCEHAPSRSRTASASVVPPAPQHGRRCPARPEVIRCGQRRARPEADVTLAGGWLLCSHLALAVHTSLFTPHAARFGSRHASRRAHLLRPAAEAECCALQWPCAVNAAVNRGVNRGYRGYRDLWRRQTEGGRGVNARGEERV